MDCRVVARQWRNYLNSNEIVIRGLDPRIHMRRPIQLFDIKPDSNASIRRMTSLF
jgi:hypothetical protein